MVIHKILRRSKEEEIDEEEYVEIPLTEEKNAEGKILVRIERLSEPKDIENILREVRENKIVLVNCQELRNRDIGELRRCIERIKRTVIAINGDVVMGPNNVLIVCPSFAMVDRKKEEVR